MSRVDLIATVRRLRLEAAESRRDVDVHIAEGLRELGWIRREQMDNGDMATELQEAQVDQALAGRTRAVSPQPVWDQDEHCWVCAECGEPNQARGESGYGRCIECQKAVESLRW